MGEIYWRGKRTVHYACPTSWPGSYSIHIGGTFLFCFYLFYFIFYIFCFDAVYVSLLKTMEFCICPHTGICFVECYTSCHGAFPAGMFGIIKSARDIELYNGPLTKNARPIVSFIWLHLDNGIYSRVTLHRCNNFSFTVVCVDCLFSGTTASLQTFTILPWQRLFRVVSFDRGSIISKPFLQSQKEQSCADDVHVLILLISPRRWHNITIC